MERSPQLDLSGDGPSRAPSALEARLARPPARVRWASLPTPVERASWLDSDAAQVWIKRDDATSSIYGGGKVRKLEWVLANPPYDDDRPVLSVGGIGSHHLLALALFLREQGRGLHALTFTQTKTEHVRTNLATLVSLGAELWNVQSRVALPWAWLGYRIWRRPEIAGQYMSAGASTALGCFGFVEAGLELAAQIEAGMLPQPKALFVTCGSAGTAAGLVLGLALAGVSTHLHLVSSVESWAFNRFLFRAKVNAAFAALRAAGLDDDASSASALLERAGVQWSIDHSAVGGGYGVPTPEGEAAVGRARDHGLALETTYTAKCLAVLGRVLGERTVTGPVLFWNTHGGNDLRKHIEPGWESRSPVQF